MSRRLIALSFVLAACTAAAQEADRLDTGACHQALDALQAMDAAAASAAASAAPGAPENSAEENARRSRREALRRHAATVCLGGSGDPAVLPHRFTTDPIPVPGIHAAAQAAPSSGIASPPLREPRVREGPLTVMSCDALGCWASDGSRLQRAGPGLLGPRGLCSTQGALLHCP